MIACFSASVPSVGTYFTLPLVRRAAELTIAASGALFFGSPPPRWITGWPCAASSAARSFRASVADSRMERARWLTAITASVPEGAPAAIGRRPWSAFGELLKP